MGVKKLERVVNIVLVFVAAIFLISVAGNFVFRQAVTSDKPLQVGSIISIPDVDWKTHNRTVIFALNRECKYCTESAPFFRKLLKAVSYEPTIDTLAVFPHAASEGEKYLEDIQVKVNKVIQADLKKMGILGAPTLAIVDGSGRVTRAWLGKLDINQQQEVFEHLGVRDRDVGASSDGEVTFVDPKNLKLEMAKNEPLVILDLESREVYQKQHIPGAINIPFDELEARAEDELSPSAIIILYDHSTEEVLAKSASAVLTATGFKRISILKGGLQNWEKAYPTIGNTLPNANSTSSVG